MVDVASNSAPTRRNSPPPGFRGFTRWLTGERLVRLRSVGPSIASPFASPAGGNLAAGNAESHDRDPRYSATPGINSERNIEAVPDGFALAFQVLGTVTDAHQMPDPRSSHFSRNGSRSSRSLSEIILQEAHRALHGATGQIVFALEATAQSQFDASFAPAMVIILSQHEEPQGLDQEAINSVTTTIVLDEPPYGDSSEGSDEVVQQQKCIVCLDTFQSSEELRVLPCFHRYHRTCIDVWLARNRHCPICKRDITA